MAHSIADSLGNRPVGMAYLLGTCAPDRRVIAFAEQLGGCLLISRMFGFSLLNSLPAKAVAQRPVGAVGNRLVGMGLKGAITQLVTFADLLQN